MPNWTTELNWLPAALQAEILDERPEGNRGDRDMVKGWTLVAQTPVRVELTKDFVERHAWLLRLSHPEARERVNARFGTTIDQGTIYDKDPARVFRYEKLPAATANPSVVVDGELWWGCGRCIAAMLRGDDHFLAWQLETTGERQ